MAVLRMLRISPHSSRAFGIPSHSSASSIDKFGSLGGKAWIQGERRSVMTAVRASVASSESLTMSESKRNNKEIDLVSLLTDVSDAITEICRPPAKRIPWKLQVQLLVERVILDCRFFTLLGVAGSLVGSVLCFLEGAFVVLESYFQYLHALSQRSGQTLVVHLLIEAIDSFIIGTAMLTFGMGIYAMFVGAKNFRGKGPLVPGSNFFGLFYLRTLPAWIEMDSVSQAKSRFGHAVTLLIQVGVLEKFKTIPLVTGLDLACFAGAVLLSSASIFLLSRLTVANGQQIS